MFILRISIKEDMPAIYFVTRVKLKKKKMRFLKEIKRQILWILHCTVVLYHWPKDNLIVSNVTREISYITIKLYTTEISGFKIVVNN